MLKQIYLIWLISCLLSGCSRKPESYGEGTTLFVLADQAIWETLEKPLRAAFERTIMTPRDETIFNVQWIAPEQFNAYATRKSIAFVGLLEDDGAMSQKVRNMLSAGVRSRVEEGSAFVFPKHEPWAKDQLLLVLAGTSSEQLASKLEENKDYLYGILEAKLRAETTTKMFEKLEQKELSQQILEKYGWTVRIQHDYFVNTDRQDENFYMLRRSLPGRERWLFVNWIDEADPSVINEDWVVARRDFLTNKFYKGDKVYQNDNNNYRTVADATLAGREALKVEGLWVNDQDLAKGTGGPFRNYTFYDEDTRRIYMIDIAVWFPEGSKEKFLRQLDIMAHSFKTTMDIERSKNKEGS